jgi:hypothetical protein
MQVLNTNNYVTVDGTIHHNSGKSSGCVAEIINVGISQAPMPDGVRRSKWAVVRHCYDDQTEILTEQRGWQLFKNLLKTDKVASLVNDELVFVSPLNHYKYDYTGEMVSFENEGVDFCVTPEHTMHVQMRNCRKKSWGEWRFRTAADIFGKVNTRVRRDAKWKGQAPQLSLGFMEWFGFWMAEGHAAIYNYDGYDKKRCIISQKNNLEYVRRLFKKAGIPYSETGKEGGQKTFWVRMNDDTKEMVGWLLDLGKATTKRVPQWLKDAPPKYIKRFLTGYIAGDGLHKKNTKTIYASTSSSQLADDLQELALRAGMVMNINLLNEAHPHIVIDGVNTKQNADVWLLTFVTDKKHTPRLKVGGYAGKYSGWKKVDYSGDVYCVEVPSHVIYVRRNKKAFWCSQSYKVLEDTTMATVFQWLPPEHFGTFKITNFSYIIDKIVLDDGTRCEIEILFRSLDKPEHVRNLLSLELTGAWFNEWREVPKIISQTMEGRCGRFPAQEDGGCTWSGIIADSNPPDTSSWQYKFFEEEVPKDPLLQTKYVLYRQPSGRSDKAENTKYLSPNYYRNLAIGKDPEFVKVYIDGDYGYIREGKPVFANYSDQLHFSESPIIPTKGVPVIVGLDFGLNPAAVFCQFLPNGFFSVFNEFISEDMGLRRFMLDVVRPFLFAHLRNYEIIITGDPSGIRRADSDEKSCYDELKILGFPASPAYTNSWLARYNAVDSFLTKISKDGKPAFRLGPNCPILRKGFNGEYKLKKIRGMDERFSEVAVKNEFSHPMDALQYACLTVDRPAQIANSYQHMGSRYVPPPQRAKISMSAWT